MGGILDAFLVVELQRVFSLLVELVYLPLIKHICLDLFYSSIHGPCDKEAPETFYKESIDLQQELKGPRLLGRDFNVTKDVTDKWGNPQSIRVNLLFMDLILR